MKIVPVVAAGWELASDIVHGCRPGGEFDGVRRGAENSQASGSVITTGIARIDDVVEPGSAEGKERDRR